MDGAERRRLNWAAVVVASPESGEEREDFWEYILGWFGVRELAEHALNL